MAGFICWGFKLGISLTKQGYVTSNPVYQVLFSRGLSRHSFQAFQQYQMPLSFNMGLPRWLSGKESACHAGDVGSIPGSGRLPGEGNGNQLQYSCLGNPMDRGALQAI